MPGPPYHGRTHGVKDEAGTYVDTGTDPIPGLVDALNAAGGGGSAHEIQEEGVALTDRPALNFRGAGVTAVDNAGTTSTDVFVRGGSGYGGVQPGHRLDDTGNRYLAGLVASSANTTNVTTAQRIDAFPFIPSKDANIDLIEIQVTAAIASSNVRVGLYEDDGNCYPAAMLFDTGNLATNTTGVKSSVVDQDVVQGLLYWVAVHYSHNSVQLRAIPVVSMMPYLGWGAPSGTAQPTINLGWKLTPGAFGALPDPFTGSAAYYNTGDGAASAVFLRLNTP